MTLNKQQFIERFVEAYIKDWAEVSRAMNPVPYLDHPGSVSRMLAHATAVGLWEVLAREPHPIPEEDER